MDNKPQYRKISMRGKIAIGALALFSSLATICNQAVISNVAGGKGVSELSRYLPVYDLRFQGRAHVIFREKVYDLCVWRSNGKLNHQYSKGKINRTETGFTIDY